MGDGAEVSANETDKEVGKVLDTPDKSKNSQIAASVSKIEDSPVFNFLNNLSPIKPVKSIYISQTINPLNFATLPSVFTSPHVSSLKEDSTILRRHRQLADPSKPEFASDCDAIIRTAESLDVVAEEEEQHHNTQVPPHGEKSLDCSHFMVDFSEDQTHSNAEDQAVASVPESSQMDLDVEERSLLDHNPSCDWVSLISDALMFDSPTYTDTCRKPLDHPELSYYASLQNEMHNIQSLCSAGKGSEKDEEAVPRSSADNNCEDMEEYEHLSGLYRGMRRRCLVFEMGGGLRRHLGENYASDSSDNAVKSENRVLQGIGLHLNSLGGGSSGNSNREILNEESENGILAMEDRSEDIQQQSSSPKKKRRRGEQSGDGEGCKRCNCKKSKCLKLYCECFAAGVYCVDLCACVDCFNKPAHEGTVLATRKQIESRNPLAFAPKVIRGSSDQPSETREDSSKTPASARHKRGCNCKKSGCLKKYCECYQGGVGCSVNCRCEGCRNAFGRKDGSHVVADNEENEMEGVKTTEELESSAAILETPLGGRRQSSLHLSFSSKKKPPRSSARSIRIFGTQTTTSKFDPHLETVKEDEMPVFLRESSSPGSGVKTLSPNGKRVSPPHSSGGNAANTTAAGLRSSRKLILQSIPSFPSLTQNQ